MWNAEGDAISLYRRSGFGLAAPPGPVPFAESLLGRGSIRFDRPPLGADAALTRVGDRWLIFTSPRLAPARMAWGIYHELAEWWLRDERDERIEDRCDQLAAALRAPRDAFREAAGIVGDDLTELAGAFLTSESSAAMRIAEVLDRPLVLVTPTRVRVRGPEYGWPGESALRELARRRRMPDGVTKVKLGDAPGRIALFGRAA